MKLTTLLLTTASAAVLTTQKGDAIAQRGALSLPEGSEDGFYISKAKEDGSVTWELVSRAEPVSPEAQTASLFARKDGISCSTNNINSWDLQDAIQRFSEQCGGGGVDFGSSISYQSGGVVVFGCNYGKSAHCSQQTVNNLLNQVVQKCGSSKDGWYSYGKSSYGYTYQGNSYYHLTILRSPTYITLKHFIMHFFRVPSLALAAAAAVQAVDVQSVFNNSNLKTVQAGSWTIQANGTALSMTADGSVLGHFELSAAEFEELTGCLLHDDKCLNEKQEGREKFLKDGNKGQFVDITTGVSAKRDTAAEVFERDLKCFVLICQRNDQCSGTSLARCQWCAKPPGYDTGACA
ncbi:hypothetical protein F4778DRAFT_785137 [Xylariomycetidae sp. FL2044]|nr:hypothetical protein F4778DRAFT_785137 [Xylariomycetidae sp. FL2044]